MITLVTGGARSGKSDFAEKLVKEAAGDAPVLYIATATNTDGEMDDRIRRHRERRPANWRTEERWQNLDRISLGTEKAILLDCVGFLLDNTFFSAISDWDDPKQEDADAAEEKVKAELTALAQLCEAVNVDLVMVTNEVGDGLVPATKVSRLYRDALGRVNCHAAALADHVYFSVCGIPMQVK